MPALRLTEIVVAPRCICCACAVGDLRFHATVWAQLPPHVAERILPMLREAAAAAVHRLGV